MSLNWDGHGDRYKAARQHHRRYGQANQQPERTWKDEAVEWAVVVVVVLLVRVLIGIGAAAW